MAYRAGDGVLCNVKVLAFSTSGALCSIAVTHGETVAATTSFEHKMRLLETLMPRTCDLLSATRLDVGEVDLIAVDTGPGSFTGVRIGVMTAKALAWASARPIVGVTSLEAISQGVAADRDGDLLVTVRARPGWTYWQLFSRTMDVWTPVSDPALSRLQDLPRRLDVYSTRQLVVATCDFRPGDAEALVSALHESGYAISDSRQLSCTAGWVAERARVKLRSGAPQDPLRLVPCYVAEPQIGVRRES